MSENDRYGFELLGKRKDSYRSRGQAAAELGKFLRRIEVNESAVQLTAESREALLEFISQHNLNIEWYERRLAVERRHRRYFTILSLALLVLIPIFIVVITNFVSGANAGVIVAAITALLTSLIATQKALGSWLDKRQLITHFWKASAALKDSLYSTQDRWEGNATAGDKLSVEFLDALRAATANARVLAKKEKDDFFTLSMYPSIDLGSALKEAGATAKNIVTSQTSPAYAMAEEQRKASSAREKSIVEATAKVAEIQAKIAGTRKIIELKRSELENGQDAEDEKALRKRVTRLEDSMATAEDALVDAEAKLSALLLQV